MKLDPCVTKVENRALIKQIVNRISSINIAPLYHNIAMTEVSSGRKELFLFLIFCSSRAAHGKVSTTFPIIPCPLLTGTDLAPEGKWQVQFTELFRCVPGWISC